MENSNTNRLLNERKMTDILLGNAVIDPAVIHEIIGYPTKRENYYIMQLGEFESELSRIPEKALSYVQEIIDEVSKGKAIFLRDDRILCVVHKPKNADSELFTKDAAFRIIEALKNQFDLTISCGISKTCNTIDEFVIGYRQAEIALSRSFFTGGFSINSYSPMDNERNRKDAAKIKKLIENDSTIIDVYDSEQFMNVFKELKNYASSADLSREYIIALYMDIAYLALSLADGKETNEYLLAETLLSTMSSAKTLRRLHKAATDLISLLGNFQAAPGNETAVIRHVKDYVVDHLNSQLSLDEIAAHVYMNPTYLSQLFHQKTGEKLRSYITTERIKKAKILLSRGTSIHETATLTGFMSDSYFIQCFKEATGYTPREFVRNYHLDCC